MNLHIGTTRFRCKHHSRIQRPNSTILARQSAPHPIGHFQIDVAHAVACLASDESRDITGHTLVVDGGRHMP